MSRKQGIRVWWMLAIAGLVAAAAAFGWLVTTFLFAFSGGQYRMVTVVRYGAVAMIVAPLVVAAVGWRMRSPLVGFVSALVAVGAGWFITLTVEWGISFVLGAG